jgi:phage tail sheath gpL-like
MRVVSAKEVLMRRFLLFAIVASMTMAIAAPSVFAGNPHFVSVTATRSDNTLTVSGKEAGLGNETQVHIEVTATAECINPGSKHPKAANKESVSAEGDFPVQNGMATFELTLTASFQPECSPPMTVRFSDVVVSDTEHNVTKRLGSF